jgi:hypothetical protein
MLLEFIGRLIVLPAVVVGFFALLFSLAELISPERIGRMTRGWWPLRLNLWHMLAAVAVAACVLLAIMEGVLLVWAITIGALLVLAWFVRAWCHELVLLMGLRDDEFPGRNDKLIWVIVLFAIAPIGPWLFRAFRSAHWPSSVPAHESQPQPGAQPSETTTTAVQPA